MPLTPKNLYDPEQVDFPGEYYAEKRRTHDYCFWVSETVEHQTFQVSELKNSEITYKFEFGPQIPQKSRNTVRPNQMVVSQQMLNAAFARALHLNDGNIGITISKNTAFIPGWTTSVDMLCCFSTSQPSQIGEQKLYLKFNPKDELIGVRVQETFREKTVDIFVASNLKPKSTLILEQEAAQRREQAAEFNF